MPAWPDPHCGSATHAPPLPHSNWTGAAGGLGEAGGGLGGGGLGGGGRKGGGGDGGGEGGGEKGGGGDGDGGGGVIQSISLARLSSSQFHSHSSPHVNVEPVSALMMSLNLSQFCHPPVGRGQKRELTFQLSWSHCTGAVGGSENVPASMRA